MLGCCSRLFSDDVSAVILLCIAFVAAFGWFIFGCVYHSNNWGAIIGGLILMAVALLGLYALWKKPGNKSMLMVIVMIATCVVGVFTILALIFSIVYVLHVISPLCILTLSLATASSSAVSFSTVSGSPSRFGSSFMLVSFLPSSDPAPVRLLEGLARLVNTCLVSVLLEECNRMVFSQLHC